MKKPTGSVRFFKPGTGKTEPEKNRKKTEPNRKNRAKTESNQKNRAKPEKTEPNRFEPVFSLKNRIEPKPVGLNRFRFFLKKKNSVWLLFLIKTEPGTPLVYHLFRNQTSVKLECVCVFPRIFKGDCQAHMVRKLN